jgi:hypothetical protein
MLEENRFVAPQNDMSVIMNGWLSGSDPALISINQIVAPVNVRHPAELSKPSVNIM